MKKRDDAKGTAEKQPIQEPSAPRTPAPTTKSAVPANYINELRGMVDVDRRFRSVESLYSEVYNRVIALEDRVASWKKEEPTV